MPPDAYRDPSRADVASLAQAVVRRDRAAVASALNLTEDARPEGRRALGALLRALAGLVPPDRGHRIGVTGPPGVGKSSLLSRVAQAMRARQLTLGVLAVDPSSVRSGGALLGDRVRIAAKAGDEGAFVRSLATAGELGGLARSVPAATCVLAAAFDVVLVETVGVGQTETDVRHVVDTVALVVQPGSGDSLQFLKAGIMEVPDVLVVNKCDEVELTRRAVLDLKAALRSLHAAGVGSGDVPVVETSARDDVGIDALIAAFDAHRGALAQRGALVARRRAGELAWALRSFARRFGEAGVERAGGEDALREKLERELRAGSSPIDAVERAVLP
jgi:LAO/AO transport system kinase